MKKLKHLTMLMAASFLFTPLIHYGQCDPPEAFCTDVTVTLDSTGQYILDPSEVDIGSTAPCGLQSITLDKTNFTCSDVNPTASPAALFQWEAGDSILQNAGEIKIDASGNVYVADINDDVIKKFDPAGNMVQTIGVKGFGVGQFASLRGIEIDGSGNIYGTDDNRDKILVFNAAGSFQFEFGSSGSGSGQFTNPWRLSVSSSGIYVTDIVQDKILVFDGSGNFQFEFGAFGTNPGDLDNPANIDHDAAGNVYILDQHRRKVIKYDAAGNFISEFGEAPSGGVLEGRLDIVEGLAIGSDGNIYVADRSSSIQNNKIMVFDNSGNFIYEFGNTGTTASKFGWAYAVAIDANDNLYVSDLIRDVYLVFDQALVGNLVTLTVTDVNGVSACCVAEVTVLEGNGCAASQDQDMDGFTPNDGDCDDTNPDVYPGATERCNGIDDNCDGTIDEDLGVWNGNFIVTSQADLDNWGSYSEITGNLNILNTDVTDLTPLSCLRKTRQLVIASNQDLKSLAGLENLEVITGSLRIVDNDSLTQITELVSLDTVGFNLGISDNDRVENISFPSIKYAGNLVFSIEIISHPLLQSISFPALPTTDERITIHINPELTTVDFSSLISTPTLSFNRVSIPDLNGFPALNSIDNLFRVTASEDITNITEIDDVTFGGSVILVDNALLSDLGTFGLNDSIPGNIELRALPSLVSLQGLDDLVHIAGNLNISSNPILSDCCAIAELLDNNEVGGSISIFNNPTFCSSDAEIISFCLDNDGDGYTLNDGDCDDTNPDINPGAIERCNGVDDNCDGTIDEDLGTYVGNFYITSQSQLNQLGSYTYVDGLIDIRGNDIVDLTPLSCLTEVKHLQIESNPMLTSLAGLENIHTVHGLLTIAENGGLTSINELASLDSVGWYVYLRQNINVTSISFPSLREIAGTVYALDIRAHDVLTTVSLPMLESADNIVRLRLNPNLVSFDMPALLNVGSLIVELNGAKDISGLNAISQINGDLEVTSNNALASLTGLQNLSTVSGDMIINGNTILSDCCTIAELLYNGGVYGTVTIQNNTAFCSSESEIIAYCLDIDGDGFTGYEGDCDDTQASVYPGALEVCDQLDNDCDGLVDYDDPDFVTPSRLALDFDGADDQVTIANHPDLQITGDQTLETWFTISDERSPVRLVGKGDGIQQEYAIYIYSFANEARILYQYTSGGGVQRNYWHYMDPFTFDQWYHIAVTRDFTQGKLTMYLNGQQVEQFNLFHTPDMTSDPVTIGKGVIQPLTHLGRMDEVAIWNTARTPSEILQDMDEINAASTDLVVYFNMEDDPSSSIITDQSGNGHDGTLQNMSTSSWVYNDCIPDSDGDGYAESDGDCDDANPSINPGQPEICNGIDDDCNGLTDLDDPGLVDDEAPVFRSSLPVDITVDCANVGNSDAVEFTDNCHAVLEFRQTSDWDGSCGNYQITRTWTVTDVGGNEISHTQIVAVEDNTAPSLVGTLPNNITVPEGSVPSPPTITAVDNCYSGQHIFMEMEPIDPSNESLSLEGTLGSVGVIWELEGVDVTQYKFRDVYTDNSLPTFSNASYFTPASVSLDGAGFNAISGDATLRISFDQPVDNPVLHINNIDISRWDFNPTTDHISLVSGNDQMDIVNGVVQDVDPATSGGLDSGLGSVMVHGTFSEIVIDLSLVDVTTDGIFLQMSMADDPVVTFSETSVSGVCPGDESITRTWTATDGCGLLTTHTQVITVEGTDPGPSIDQVDIAEDPIELDNPVTVVGYYSDTCDIDDHQATWIWGDGNSSSGVIDQSNNWVDGIHTYDSAGVYQVTLVLSDSDGNSDTLTAATYVVIYNPDGGFVTGGGWILSPPGAYVPDPTATGKANFGFVSKYKKGASVPTGNTQFKFNAASFKFKSTSYDWLVISGSNAKYKGVGKVNNQGNYGFMLTGIDGDLNGSGGGVDKFRIKIWDKDQNDLVVYDNKMGSDDTGYDTQELGGGSITIHGTNGNGNNNSIAQLIEPEDTIIDKHEMKVYPNPSSGRVNIEINQDWLQRPTSLTIHNINGQLIHQVNNVKSANVSVEIKNEGVYFVTIINSEERITKKCIVVK